MSRIQGEEMGTVSLNWVVYYTSGLNFSKQEHQSPRLVPNSSDDITIQSNTSSSSTTAVTTQRKDVASLPTQWYYQDGVRTLEEHHPARVPIPNQNQKAPARTHSEQEKSEHSSDSKQDEAELKERKNGAVEAVEVQARVGKDVEDGPPTAPPAILNTQVALGKATGSLPSQVEEQLLVEGPAETSEAAQFTEVDVDVDVDVGHQDKAGESLEERWTRIEATSMSTAAPKPQNEPSSNFLLVRLVLKQIKRMYSDGEITLTQKSILKDLIVSLDESILAVAEIVRANNDFEEFGDSLLRLCLREESQQADDSADSLGTSSYPLYD